jgi:hypothetical protein
LAFGVQAKISRDGIEPRHIVENNMEKILENIAAEWRGENG